MTHPTTPTPSSPAGPLTDEDLMLMAEAAGLNVHEDPEPDFADPDHDLLHYWQHGQIADGALLAFARAIERRYQDPP